MNGAIPSPAPPRQSAYAGGLHRQPHHRSTPAVCCRRQHHHHQSEPKQRTQLPTPPALAAGRVCFLLFTAISSSSMYLHTYIARPSIHTLIHTYIDAHTYITHLQPAVHHSRSPACAMPIAAPSLSRTLTSVPTVCCSTNSAGKTIRYTSLPCLRSRSHGVICSTPTTNRQTTCPRACFTSAMLPC